MSRDNTIVFGPKGLKIGDGIGIQSKGIGLLVGGNMHNKGRIESTDSTIVVSNDFLNEGELKINDPQLIKQAVLEAAKSAKDVTEFGTIIAKKLFG